MEDAIHAVLDKGTPIGGTSAGLFILSEYAFSAQRNTILSSQAIKNPYQFRLISKTRL